MSKKRSIVGIPLGMHHIYGAFIGMALANAPKPDENNLGGGLRLVPLEVEDNTNEYSHLYKDGKKVSDTIFRRGGIGGNVKDGYVSLISYPKYPETTSIWVLLNAEGKVVMQEDSQFSHDIHHIKGHIASKKETYYDLLTGKAIAAGSKYLESAQYLFVEHRFDWNNKKFPTGVYRIDVQTREVEFYPSK